MQITYSTNQEDFVNMVHATHEHQPSMRRKKLLALALVSVFAFGLGLLNMQNTNLSWLLTPLFVIGFFVIWLFMLDSLWAKLTVKQQCQSGLRTVGQFEIELENEQLVVRSESQDTRHNFDSIFYILTNDDYCFIILNASKFLGIPIRRSSVTEGDFEEFTKALKTRWLAEPLTSAKIKKFET